MRRIVCAESVLYANEIFSHLGQVDVIPDAALSSHHLKQADALIVRSKTTVDGSLLAGTPVKFVGTATAGIDHIDVSYLEENQITFATAAGSNATSVAEYVIAALLTVMHIEKVDLFNKTLGIIGAGHVGRQLAAMANALGMKVLLNDPPLQLQTHDPHLIPLDQLLAQADIVSLHVPLVLTGNFPTGHLVNDEFLSRLKPGCILINTSRGEVIEESCLLLHVLEGALGPLIIDVWDNEPYINLALLKKVMLGTPHIAGYSTDGRVNGSLFIYQALCRFWKITPTISVEHLFKESQQAAIIAPLGLSVQETLYEIVKKTYDITQDHQSLLMSIHMSLIERGEYFNYLRQQYSSRWEFSHYPVKITQQDDRLNSVIQGINFL